MLHLGCCSSPRSAPAGDGLEIPVEKSFFGDKTAVTWMKMHIEKIENNVNDKLNRCIMTINDLVFS